MANPRDPRVDPKEGDILLAPGNNRLEVFQRKPNRILYKLTSVKPIYPTDAIPMQCGAYLKDWKKITKEAEVIRAAE